VDRRSEELHVYIDETCFELDDQMMFGSGALLTTAPVGEAVVRSALDALRNDEDRLPTSPSYNGLAERLDAATLERGGFHASEDSGNAHSHLARAVKANVSGMFTASFSSRSRKDDEAEYRKHFLGTFLSAFRRAKQVNLTLERRPRLSDGASADALVEYFMQGADFSAFALPQLPLAYPKIVACVGGKDCPGLQVADLLLWSLVQEQFRKKGDKFLRWCGFDDRFSSSHQPEGDAPGKYFILGVNRGLRRLLASDTDDAPYPVTTAEMETPIDLRHYAIGEQIVRACLTAGLPPDAEHLRAAALAVLRRFDNPERVGPDDILLMARQLLRLFDTVPVYAGWERERPDWLLVLRARRLMSFLVRYVDAIDGRLALNMLAERRRDHVKTHPEWFGLRP
jgi:hypothetical protein